MKTFKEYILESEQIKRLDLENAIGDIDYLVKSIKGKEVQIILNDYKKDFETLRDNLSKKLDLKVKDIKRKDNTGIVTLG